jgi:hypothetical protein
VLASLKENRSGSSLRLVRPSRIMQTIFKSLRLINACELEFPISKFLSKTHCHKTFLVV